jgi:hypothetical protein
MMKPKITAPIIVMVSLASILLLAFGFFISLKSVLRQVSYKVECGNRLLGVDIAMLGYANDHNDVVSSNLDDLVPYIRPEESHPFVCPISGVQYILVSGLTLDMPSDTVSAYCPGGHRLFNGEKDRSGNRLGLNVVFLNGVVTTVEMSAVKDLFTEQRVDYRPLN